MTDPTQSHRAWIGGMSVRSGFYRRALLVLALTLAVVMPCVLLSLPAAAAKTVKVTADSRLTHQGAKGDTIIEGGLSIEYDDIRITADKATVNMSAGTALLTGGVTLVQGDVRLTSDAMNINMKADEATMSGNVRLTKLEEQQERDAAGKPVTSTITLACSTLKISTATQDFEADGKVTLGKGGQTAQCDHAVYSSSAKSVVLSGAVIIKGEDNESIKCDKATIYTDRDRLEAEGKSMEIVFSI